ncbi:MAG TPA: efflux RND transporter periplasmic adaptor subunit [Blastocatellia bacterium]|nr:efflux RND transporter periplasmic adaptor subunit [Blastocatellia bacterium]
MRRETNHHRRPDLKGSRRSRLLILACCLLPCALPLAGCRERATAAGPAPVAVRVQTVELNPAGKGVRYAANIEPLKQVELAFRVGGYLDRILPVRGVDGRLRELQAGDLVTRGTVLAHVRQSDYAVKLSQAQSQASEARSSLEASRAQWAESQSAVASSQAQLAEADAAFEKARLDFDRARSLFSSKSFTKADFDGAKMQFEAAAAKQAAARNQVAMLQARERSAAAQIEVVKARIDGSQARIEEAAIPLQDTALRAPMDGLVLQKSVEIGALVSPGRAGFVIADTTSVKAVFGVPDMIVNKLKLGSPLTVTTESIPDTEFRGRITRISPAADAKSRVFEIEVTIPNPQRLLKPGLIAAMELAEAAPSREVAVVPLAAIVRAKEQPEQYAVFTVQEQNGRPVARLREITLGETFGNTIAVLDGVKVGERVITLGATLVIDGQPVQIIP